MSTKSVNNKNSSTDKEEIGGEKISMSRFQTNKSNIEINSNSNYQMKSKTNGGKVYPYPILYYKERDPLEEFKLKIIKSKNKGSDTFHENYLKFNFAKNDASKDNMFNITKVVKSKISNKEDTKSNLLENSRNNNLFITEKKKFNIKLDISKSKNDINKENNSTKKFKSISIITNKHFIKKSRSDIFNPYSKTALSQYRTSYLHEMEKRGNMYNKIKIAQLQRIALQNFSSMSLNGNHYVNGSIPTGKSDESYILETKKRKRLPGIKEYICSRLKNMRNEEINTPEFYRERSKKYVRNKLPEIINIKNSGRFQFHVFHDQYGYKKELDKKKVMELKMTKDKIRDLKIMAKISKINDPELIDIYKRAVYSS